VPRHLIVGISGQDGAYLAQQLLHEGEYVIGTSRSSCATPLPNLTRLRIADSVRVISTAPSDGAALLAAIRQHDIDRVYLLAGQSSVGLSFAEPVETYRGLVTPALTLLDTLRREVPHVRLLYAGSGEVFSPDDGLPFTEQSRHSPKSPYAVAKSAATTLVDTYRAVYGVFASTAILFNHESPLRPRTFVLPKIVAAAARMARGSDERLPLGDIDIGRDWGWAPEYVVAMRRIIEHDTPDNFIVATGVTHSIRDAITLIGKYVGVDLLERCDTSRALLRPCDARTVRADPGKLYKTLGWRATTSFAHILNLLCEAAVAESLPPGSA
jgi:GDPmannose 4,6-dehydratase